MSDPNDELTSLDMVVVWLTMFLCAVIGLWLPLRMIPGFAAMYADFGGHLSPTVAWALRRWPVAIASLPPLALMVRGLASRAALHTRRLTLAAALVLALVTVVAVLYVVYLPIMELAGSIQ